MRLKTSWLNTAFRILIALSILLVLCLFFFPQRQYTTNTKDFTYAQENLNKWQHGPINSPDNIKEVLVNSIDAKREKVKEAFLHAWKGYSKFAYGKDQYHPLSENGENMLGDKGGIGFTIVDSLDTIILMGLEEEYQKAKEWIETSLDFELDGTVNVFETTIRVLGGLLSSYHLKKDPILLIKAEQLGERLVKGFYTKSGIPIPTINLKTGEHSYESQASTSEAATLQLENKFLSHLTKNRTYWDLSQKVNQIIAKQDRIDGLVPIYMNVRTGLFEGSEIRLGSRGDSYYEYLLKQWLLTNHTQPEFRILYDESMVGVKKHLVGYTSYSNLTFIGEITTSFPDVLSPKMDHLVCFLAGNLALGATEGLPISKSILSKTNKEDLDLAERLAETCWYTYTMNPTGLAAEITFFKTEGNTDAFVKYSDSYSLLRPETIESLFILYRITENEKYRDWGWKMFESFEKYAKVANGFTNLDQVTQEQPEHRDNVETFFLAETLKYFYLLFSPTDVIPLDKYVFNTEAHPFPKFMPDSNSL